MPKLEFHGAAGTVTGSMHLLHLDAGPVALDCGLFQGRRAESRERNETFPIDPRDIKAVLLSHAHIDHSGKIPRLVRKKFRGCIYATAATCDLCEVMLADSAHIQTEDARYWNKKHPDPEDRIRPLYVRKDALAAARHFLGVHYNSPFPFADGAVATFVEAGHILGSACVLIELHNGRRTRILYTGDIGRFDLPILRDPTNPLPKADYLITESTYANRHHAGAVEMKDALVRIINQTRARGGKVIIPSFSVGRTQHVIYFLSQAMADRELEPLPIYVDSPLSVNVTHIFKRHPECYDEQARDFWQEQGDLFGRGLITYITDVRQSKALHARKEPCVILSASGMCEAGRILHHLKNNVEDERNTIVVVGYMAQHTLGRRLVERREQIKIFGMMYDVMAQVEVLNGFSAHADADDFKRMFAPIAPDLKAAFVVHGEKVQLEAMKDLLGGLGCREVHAPVPGQKFDL